MNKLNSINDLAFYIKNRGNKLEPVTSSKIFLIEKEFKITLPEVYKQFLQLMGNGAGEYMRGSSVFYDEIFSLRKWADELVHENDIEPIPNDAFVFWMHQGYQAAYFKLNEGDNPPVYYFSEGQESDGFKLKEKSLSDFFASQLLFII